MGKAIKDIAEITDKIETGIIFINFKFPDFDKCTVNTHGNTAALRKHTLVYKVKRNDVYDLFSNGPGNNTCMCMHNRREGRTRERENEESSRCGKNVKNW